MNETSSINVIDSIFTSALKCKYTDYQILQLSCSMEKVACHTVHFESYDGETLSRVGSYIPIRKESVNQQTVNYMPYDFKTISHIINN